MVATPQQPDLVLIDDDELIQAAWRIGAQNRGHSIICFNGLKDFLAAGIEKSVPVYIDYHFRSNENGLDVATKLFETGYLNLFLTTGSSKEDINAPYCIQGIFDKQYPSAIAVLKNL